MKTKFKTTSGGGTCQHAAHVDWLQGEVVRLTAALAKAKRAKKMPAVPAISATGPPGPPAPPDAVEYSRQLRAGASRAEALTAARKVARLNAAAAARHEAEARAYRQRAQASRPAGHPSPSRVSA